MADRAITLVMRSPSIAYSPRQAHTGSAIMTASPSPPLARLLSARDPASRDRAWAEFVRSYSPLLVSTARRLCSDHDATMDRYTYILEQLRRNDFRRLRRYAVDGRSRFTTWLVVVARRLCIDYHRQRYGRPRSEADGSGEVERVVRQRLTDFMAEDLDLVGGISSNGPDPERELRRRELRSALSAALQALPEPDRLLLALRHEEEMRARDIARLMGYESVFHVYRRLNALHGSLRETLEREGVDDATP
jgi:RNA polymerase sigma factor (sigma-70 family)